MKLKTGKRFRKMRRASVHSPDVQRLLRWAEHTRYDRYEIEGRNAPGRLIPASKVGRGRWKR